MDVLDDIDDNPLWELDDDAYNSDIDSPIVPAYPAAGIDLDGIWPADDDYCADCGHYGGCYAPGISCGDYRCCQP